MMLENDDNVPLGLRGGAFELEPAAAALSDAFVASFGCEYRGIRLKFKLG